MTKICCVCHRVEKGRYWRDDYVVSPGERVTHGYCPLCFDIIMEELGAYIERKGLAVSAGSSGNRAGTKELCAVS